MKISKSVLDAISEAMRQPTNQHSSRGNYVSESVKSTNPGYGYHGTAPEGSNVAAADTRYAATHKTVSKITGAGPVVVKHYLDSTHGRHLESREGDHAYIKKDFADFSKKYKPEHFNESLLDRGPNDTDLEDLEEADLSEGTLEKLTLDQLKKRHADHHESGGGSDRSYKAMEAIEKHVAHKYGPKAVADLHKSTEKHALSGGDGMAVLKKMHEAYNESLQAHELPTHVKKAVSQVHAVLKKHKVMGAHVSVAHHDYEPKHEKASGGHHEINIQVGRHHAENEDLIDDLHATQPHKWYHRKGDVAICPCASIHPSPRHNLHEEVMSEAIRPGDTDGRSHTDAHGVTWDDEGHNSAGTGHNDSRPKSSSKAKHYHTVPYKDKEHAKGEGMKWDKDKSKWYHTDAAKSATSKFRKLQEEEQIDEKTAPMTDDGKKATHTIHVNDDGYKIKTHIVAKDNKHAAQIARSHFPDNAFRVHAIKEEEQIDELRTSTLQSYLATAKSDHKLVTVDGKKKVEMLSAEKKKARITGINRAYDKVLDRDDVREEIELDEGERFDHREAAQKGIIHPHAFAGMKVGSYHDHYSTKNGDKLQFKVHKHTADGVVLQTSKADEKEHGKYHTYKISHEYDRKLNEEKKVVGHKFVITTTDPHSTAVSQRTEKHQKIVRVANHPEREKAAARAKSFYTLQGFKVHDVIHHSEIYEEIEQVDEASKHEVIVHYIDRNKKKQALSHRGYHASKDAAIMAAVSHHLKAGTPIEKVEYKALNEMIEEIPVEFELAEGATQEGHATKAAADKAMEAHEKKHPLAKHTVMQGRRSGRWHVVRHTSGGMHVVEEVEALEEKAPASSDHHYIASLVHDLPNHDGTTAMNALPKEHKEKIKAFRKSAHWKAVDKKHTDPQTGEQDAGGHVDDDVHAAFHKWHKETYGTKHKPVIQESCNSEVPKKTWRAWLEGKGFPNQEKFEPKDVVKEGDESEAEYQEYLKSLKEKKKKVSTIKTIVRNK